MRLEQAESQNQDRQAMLSLQSKVTESENMIQQKNRELLKYKLAHDDLTKRVTTMAPASTVTKPTN